MTGLAWSGDGAKLALGTQDGVLAWIGLLDALFAARAPSAPAKSLPTEKVRP